jgi:tRNA nucleotidyltransferase (CCA-adding enzyme)
MSDSTPFHFVDDVTSDLTFEARGETLPDLFVAASQALLAAAVERPGDVREQVERRLELSDERLDWLMRRFLDELVYLLDAEHLLLRAREVEIRGEGEIGREGEIHLSAALVGESFDRARHSPAHEIKAVTAYRLAVGRDPHGVWRARVTLDV